MIVVGLTGGIGTGKSTVAKLFEVMGVPVYNSDDRAKAMYFMEEVKTKVVDLLGTEVYKNENEINREVIAKKIFSNSTLLSKINSIIHPAVENDFKLFLEANKHQKFVVKETALLFETGLYKKVDKIVLVMAPMQLRIDRVKERDHVTEEEIYKRIKHQMPDEEKQPISDFVIDNNEINGLIPQVLAVYNKLQNA